MTTIEFINKIIEKSMYGDIKWSPIEAEHILTLISKKEAKRKKLYLELKNTRIAAKKKAEMHAMQGKDERVIIRYLEELYTSISYLEQQLGKIEKNIKRLNKKKLKLNIKKSKGFCAFINYNHKTLYSHSPSPSYKLKIILLNKDNDTFKISIHKLNDARYLNPIDELRVCSLIEYSDEHIVDIVTLWLYLRNNAVTYKEEYFFDENF